MFKKKKKETAEELRAKLLELEGEDFGDELLPTALPQPPRPPKPPQKVKEVKVVEEEPAGEFNLDESEMLLAVNALVNSEEFKIYRQLLVGQQIAKIVDGYNKVIREKNEIQGNPEDTDEELPK